MARRIFISYQHEDRMKAKGFHLLRWNKNVDLDFVGRHLLDPVKSENVAYIRSKVREQLHGTSATIVLLGKKTYQSGWVEWEIRKSLEKGKPNGILAIRLEPGVPLPQNSPVGAALHEVGAEIIDWDSSQFADAIERACLATGRAAAIRRAADGASGSSSCAR